MAQTHRRTMREFAVKKQSEVSVGPLQTSAVYSHVGQGCEEVRFPMDTAVLAKATGIGVAIPSKLDFFCITQLAHGE